MSSLHCDGSSGHNINFGSGSALDNLSTITFLMWIYPTRFTDFQVFLHKGVDGGNGKFLHTNTSSGGLYGFSGNQTGAVASYYESTRSFSLDTWQFFGASFNASGGSGAKWAFCRGTLSTLAATLGIDFADEGSGPYNDSGDDLRLGNSVDLDQDLDMRYGFFGVWNRALSLGEMRAQQYRPHKTSGCVLFSFPGANGTSGVPDWSGGGNNGTVPQGGTLAAGVPLGPPFGGDFWLPYAGAAPPVAAVRVRSLAMTGVGS
jgi:hypothetical protein